MSGVLLTAGAKVVCPHGGQIRINTTNARVMVSGQPVAILTDLFLVDGCNFMVPPSKPQPCLRVKWLTSATRVFVNNQPVILQTSVGICLSLEEIPQGAPVIVYTQARVTVI